MRDSRTCRAEANRRWIGIDITHLAISLIEKRMRDAFKDAVPPIEFDVHGIPTSLEGARELAARDKYEFQYWACSLVNAQPYQGKKKGADSGIDGLIFFQDDKGQSKKIIVSIKGGENVGVPMVKTWACHRPRKSADRLVRHPCKPYQADGQGSRQRGILRIAA